MLKLIVMSLFLFSGSFLLAHSDHITAPQIQLVTEDIQNKPEYLRATSVKLLETPIEITRDHGQGRFFQVESTEVQRLVNQGFAMLNMFQYTDAFRSFHTAISIEPTSVESYIGRAFASMSLDGSQSYYLSITKDFLEKNKAVLTVEQKAWSNLLLAIMIQKDIEGNVVTTATVFEDLKQKDSDNLEVSIFANWVSNTYDVALLENALKNDNTNAGATHYLLHLAEMRSDHDAALLYGKNLIKFASGSGHGQHMYGHVLPHFNRWNEANRQFTRAHNIHMAWAKKNNVPPSEDWHYSHNLDLWSVTQMVLNPSEAVQTLAELEQFSFRYVLDLLDLRIITGTDAQVEDDFIASYEERSPDWENFVTSSRKLHTLINQSAQYSQIRGELLNNLKWQESPKDNTIYVAIFLIDAVKAGDTQKQEQAINYITSKLSKEFTRGGFDGWRKSVLETLIYKKVFQVYALDKALEGLKEKVIDVHMNPVD